MEESIAKPPTLEEQMKKAFNDLFEATLAQNSGESITTIEYILPYPKEDFLKFLVDNKNVLLHGSSEKEVEIIEPKQANDKEKISGNKNAIYCVADPVLPIFYAIRDRNKIQGVIESGFSENPETKERKYRFKIPKSALEVKPWAKGVVYIFDKKDFHPEKDDNGGPSGEWISEVPVKPIAKLEVSPEDFRFINEVEGVMQ